MMTMQSHVNSFAMGRLSVQYFICSADHVVSTVTN